MNETHVTDVKSVIKDIMEFYLFEKMDETTIRNITNDIAMSIDAKEFYDYFLDVKSDNNNIVIDLCIKETISDGFLNFHAAYNDFPAVINTPNDEVLISFKAFDCAMEVVK